MSSKPQTTTTNQNKTPLSGPQGNLFSNIWGDTSSTLNTALNQQVPQNTVAPLTAPQTQGANWFDTVAPSLSANAGGTSNLLGEITSGYFSNPQNNPNFEGAVNAALAPATQNLTQNVIPHIQDTSLRASGGGTGPAAYGSAIPGSSPQDKLTENVLQNWGNTEANTVASMANNAFNTGLGLTSQVPGLAQSATSQALAPGSALETGGGILQQGNQGNLQNILNSYYLTGQGPLGFLSSGANIGSAGGFGNTTGVTTGPQPNMATQWLQGLTGGASGLNSLFGSGPGGSSSAFGNIASGIGNAASGAGSWLNSLNLGSMFGVPGATDFLSSVGPAAALAL